MQDDDNLADFIESQRAKIARERELLKDNPASAITENTINREFLQINKENHSPRITMKQSLQHRETHDVQQQQKRPPSTPRIFRLGEEYNKKREKLKEELRADYRTAMAEKNSRGYRLRDRRGDGSENITSSVNERKSSDLGLSLPIRDHPSAKERLRKQRNREYNEFIKCKEEVEMMKHAKKDQSPVRGIPVNKSSDHQSQLSPRNVHCVPSKIISVKDIDKETYEELLDRKRRQETSYRASNKNQDDEIFRSKRSGFVEEDYDEEEGYYPQRKVRFPVKGRRAQPRGRKHRYEDDEDAYQARGRNRRGGRLRRAVESDEDSDDFDDEDDLEYMPSSRKLRGKRTEKKRIDRSYEREATTGSIDMNVGKKTEDSLRSRSAPPEEMNTGLLIGNVPSANTVQRKKEVYRLELLQQMEDKKMTNKRAKELDMRIEASAATLPELQTFKKTDTMKNVSAKQRKNSPTPGDERSHQKSRKKTKYKLDLSSSEEDDDEDLRRGMRRSRRAMHPQSYYMQPPMHPGHNMGYYPPQMPQYPTPYEDAYLYYGSRNPLDPPGIIPPAAPGGYQNGLPAMMASSSMPEQRGRRVADAGEDVSGATKSILRRSHNIESSLVADEKRDEENKRNQKKVYQDELKIQIEQKNREKVAAKAEQERYDLKMSDEARNYNPWGKGGGGAPMKDRHGNLVTDLRFMHLENEEMVRDPTKAIEIVQERLPQTNTYRGDNRPVIDLSPRQQEDGKTSPGFGRSNPFEQKQSDEQKVQRDQYKDYLQMQIEEKKRLEAEKRQREKLEEEKEERQLEEQRKKIQAELDAELEKERNKKEMARLRAEDLKNKVEEKKNIEIRKKMEDTLRQEEEIRRQKEAELDQKLKRATTNKSPPVPAIQNTQTAVQEQRVIRTPQQRNASVQPPILRGQSPALDDNREKLRSRAESKRISRELSALRKQLLSEQRRVENQLRSVDQTAPYHVKTQMRAKTDLPVDLSRMHRKPVAVRRPPTVENDRPSSKALREFTDYKYRPDDADSASLRMFKTEYPESPTDGRSLEQQQRALIAKQGHTLDSLRHRQRSDEQPTYSKRRGPAPMDTRPPSSAVSRTSLLEAETTYIPVIMDDEFDDRPLIDSSQTTPRQSRYPSARERRRMAQKPPSAQSERRIPPSGRPDNYSLNSLTSLATLDVERMANKNRDRLDKLQAIQGDDISLTDPDDILDRFVNKHKGTGGQRPFRDPDVVGLPLPSFNTRPPSVNTVDTEPWLRPETGATHA